MDFNLRIQKDEYGNKVVKFNLSHTERITLPYETAKSLNKQLSCALDEPINDASALPIHSVSGMCECKEPIDAGSDYPDVFHKCSKCGLSID